MPGGVGESLAEPEGLVEGRLPAGASQQWRGCAAAPLSGTSCLLLPRRQCQSRWVPGSWRPRLTESWETADSDADFFYFETMPGRQVPENIIH